MQLQDLGIVVGFLVLCVKYFMCFDGFVMDEIWFHFSGFIDNHKIRIWSGGNPHALHENPLHLSKIMFHAHCVENKLWDQQLLWKIAEVFD